MNISRRSFVAGTALGALAAVLGWRPWQARDIVPPPWYVTAANDGVLPVRRQIVSMKAVNYSDHPVAVKMRASIYERVHLARQERIVRVTDDILLDRWTIPPGESIEYVVPAGVLTPEHETDILIERQLDGPSYQPYIESTVLQPDGSLEAEKLSERWWTPPEWIANGPPPVHA